jgi:signal transduction histidine kinase
VNSFRSESLKYCLGFTLITGIVLAYAGIWSLHVNFGSDTILKSSVDLSVWIVCGFNLLGYMVAYFFREKSPVTSSWLLCLTQAGAIFTFIAHTFNPLDLLIFLIPILFAIVLLELKQSVAFVASVVLFVLILFYVHSNGWGFLPQIAFPISILIAIAIFMELILTQIHTNLKWYHQHYQTALINEQIIRENEIKLERLVDNLKDYKRYLSETNMSLIQARDEAEEARTVKQNFAQNVSHELRTPLNLIIGFSETMINSPESYGEVNWTPDLHGDIECIYQNSQHLKALIDDILDMASLESKKYEVELSTVDLNSLIHEMVLITDSAYKNKGLYLETNLSPLIKSVRGDAIRLKQVMLNLLSNALKYTNQGGVLITSTVLGSMACVLVKDTGKGIPEEDLDKVFEAFFQVDRSNDREDYGTGLGLSISKQLIELQGGEMSLESELGKGTTVYFSVPLSENQ